MSCFSSMTGKAVISVAPSADPRYAGTHSLARRPLALHRPRGGLAGAKGRADRPAGSGPGSATPTPARLVSVSPPHLHAEQAGRASSEATRPSEGSSQPTGALHTWVLGGAGDLEGPPGTPRTRALVTAGSDALWDFTWRLAGLCPTRPAGPVGRRRVLRAALRPVRSVFALRGLRCMVWGEAYAQ